LPELKGKVTILFITHQLPKGLQVDEAVVLGKNETAMQTTQMKNQNTTEVSRAE
jgi:ATP-binding cassette, subfamily B, bacterial HlyB/CyaB